jgi:hypothetical protein
MGFIGLLHGGQVGGQIIIEKMINYLNQLKALSKRIKNNDSIEVFV